MLEGATLSREDVCGLQLPPPWKVQGNALNYGLGLISSYFICDLLTIVSSGYFFIFDPLGLALAATSNSGPAAKLFSLTGEVQPTFYYLFAETYIGILFDFGETYNIYVVYMGPSFFCTCVPWQIFCSGRRLFGAASLKVLAIYWPCV